MALKTLLEDVKSYSGFQSKKRLQRVLLNMQACSDSSIQNGDDTAVIPNGDGFNLFAMEGFIPEFVANDPWFAGWCGVMVNCSDIAAMGGVPVAVTNSIWCQDDDALMQMARGMNAASQAFGVPIVGGHTCQDSPLNQLSVSIIGHATHVLSSFDAKPNHVLLCAIDLRGEYREPFLNWNAATSAPSGQLQQDIALLPKVASMPGVSGAKDISQAGLLGTAAMFMDCSRCGVEIDLDRIPKPAHVSWLDWLRSFPSFGYLITCEADVAPQVLAIFQQRNINAACIGQLNNSARITVTHQHENEVFWDFQKQPFMMPSTHTKSSSEEPDHARNYL